MRPGGSPFDHSYPHPVSSHQFNQKKEPQLSDQTSPRPDGQTNNFPNVWRGTRRGERERGVVVVRTADKWDLMVSLRAMPVACTINKTTVFGQLDAVYCQICAYYTCFAPIRTAKHPFFVKENQCCTSLRDQIKDTILRDRTRRKKLSIQRDSNPQPQEFYSAGVCSTTVLPADSTVENCTYNWLVVQ